MAVFKSELKSDLKSLESKLDLKISEVKSDIRELEACITVKVGTMIFALAGFLLAIKFLGH